MASEKTVIIEDLFNRRWNAATRTLSTAEVTLEDVRKAIERYNRGRPVARRMSQRNPANFFKDFVRRKASANVNWPRSVLAAGYTARQTIGGGKCFEFVTLARGQTDPFPLVIQPTARTPHHRIESVSLPLASRLLGRAEETWITQVAVRLRVIEAHLALFSTRKDRIIQVDHLQMSARIGPEIDALYLVIEESGLPTQREEAIVSCEAKGRGDDLLEDQILEQARAVFDVGKVAQNLVIPMGIKVVGKSELYVVEFQAVTRGEVRELESLTVASDAVYELYPRVPGIG